MRKIIRRRTVGDDPEPPLPKDTTVEERWVKVDSYPLMDHELVRGVGLYRTIDPSPLRYRIVISAFIQGKFRIPASVAILNERRIRFGRNPVEFGFLEPGQRKVTHPWVTELPSFGEKDVVRSNPDFVELRDIPDAED